MVVLLPTDERHTTAPLSQTLSFHPSAVCISIPMGPDQLNSSTCLFSGSVRVSAAGYTFSSTAKPFHCKIDSICFILLKECEKVVCHSSTIVVTCDEWAT